MLLVTVQLLNILWPNAASHGRYSIYPYIVLAWLPLRKHYVLSTSSVSSVLMKTVTPSASDLRNTLASVIVYIFLHFLHSCFTALYFIRSLPYFTTLQVQKNDLPRSRRFFSFSSSIVLCFRHREIILSTGRNKFVEQGG